VLYISLMSHDIRGTVTIRFLLFSVRSLAKYNGGCQYFNYDRFLPNVTIRKVRHRNIEMTVMSHLHISAVGEKKNFCVFSLYFLKRN